MPKISICEKNSKIQKFKIRKFRNQNFKNLKIKKSKIKKSKNQNSKNQNSKIRKKFPYMEMPNKENHMTLISLNGKFRLHDGYTSFQK